MTKEKKIKTLNHSNNNKKRKQYITIHSFLLFSVLKENYTIIKCTVWWIFKKQTLKWRPRILSEVQKSPFDTSHSLVTTPYPRQTLLQFLPSVITFVSLKNKKLNLTEIIQYIFFLSGCFCSAICFWDSSMWLW